VKCIRENFTARTNNISKNNGGKHSVSLSSKLTAHQSIKLRFPHRFLPDTTPVVLSAQLFCRHLCYSPVPGCLGYIWHQTSWKEKNTQFLINPNSFN